MAVVPVVQARLHLSFHHATVARGTANGAGLFTQRSLAVDEGTLFWDAKYGRSEDPVLYLFDSVEAGESASRTLVSASTDSPASLLGIESGPSAPMSDLVAAATAEAARAFPSADSFLPTVHSFPKLGIGGYRDGVLLGVFELGTQTPLKYSLGPDDAQGQTIWSYWDEVPQSGEETGFARDALAIQTILSQTAEWLGYKATALSADELLASMTEARPPAAFSSLLPVPLMPQLTAATCAAASLAMIHGYVYGGALDLAEVASEMRTTSTGAYVSDQVLAFEHYFGQDFTVSLEQSPTFARASEQVVSYLPLKSGIKGHARTAVGVQELRFVSPLSGEAILDQQLLVVHDPLPVGVGRVRYENVASTRLRDFITLKRK